MLLLTDGLANVGITDRDELIGLAYDLRRRGVSTSTFGVGTDFDEGLLQGMADAGGGHFYFIGDVAQMRDHITSEVGETLEVVAREVVLELDAARVRPGRLAVAVPRRAARRPRARVPRRHGVGPDALDRAAGDVRLRRGRPRGRASACGSSDRDGAFERAEPALDPVTLAWTYADNPANDAQPRDRDVDRVVARLFAERAKQEAVALNRKGQFDDAGRALDGVRKRVAAYAGSDTELREIVAELREEVPVYAAAMPEMARKQRSLRRQLQSRGMRMPDGKSTPPG